MRFFRRDGPRVEAVTHLSAVAARQLRETAKRSRRQAAVLAVLLAAVYLAFHYRTTLFGLDMPVRVACALALVALGWRLARDVGRALSPALLQPLEPGT